MTNPRFTEFGRLSHDLFVIFGAADVISSLRSLLLIRVLTFFLSFHHLLRPAQKDGI